MRIIWTQVGDLLMHARVWDGDAPPRAPIIVLVHGLGVSSRYMIPTAERLAPHARVYAPDLPGSGKTEKPPHVLDVDQLADSLAGWMHESGLARASFVANSLGCQVVVDLAARYPALVERLVLTSPTVNSRRRSRLRQIIDLTRDIPREPLSLVPIVLFDYLTAGIFRGLRTLSHALADPIEKKLPQVQAPALVVCGGRDPLVPEEWAKEVAALLPHGRLALLPAAPHAVNYNSPDELSRLVLDFLSDEAEEYYEDETRVLMTGRES